MYYHVLVRNGDVEDVIFDGSPSSIVALSLVGRARLEGYKDIRVVRDDDVEIWPNDERPYDPMFDLDIVEIKETLGM